MAEHEPLAGEATAQDFGAHERDYARFTKLLKWGAIASFITGFIVVLIIS